MSRAVSLVYTTMLTLARYRLQRFKLNIASSVVTQQNSDLSSLGTDQILDLFNVSSSDAPPVVSKERATGQKAILEGLGDLPPEEECESLYPAARDD